ncbi:hypothetical protein JZ751_007526 [Albula glossodonta]|uniref:Carboxylic ester hydrolase n=1 Tax=Albula glossodonta TaxID=121402 RepID=A0A8T2NDG8_9TELE|nr:hypothetical protein JZ751_007526 [Albula glossodonta]
MSEDVYEVRERNEYRYLVQEEGEEHYCRRSYVSPVLVLSRRCIFLIASGVVALLALAGYLAYVAQTPPHGYADVYTDCGALRGRQRDGVFSFRGIPYAAPPVGERRWRPPADLQASGLCWKGLYDATRPRSMCAQVQPLDETGRILGEEDCLHLSVWTPTLSPDARLPVMVWIHGGFLHMLSGSERGYSPNEELTAQTGLVYVSLNYRLNAFGFLALELLRQGSPTNSSGNYGFMDQIAALRWVQKNIHVFGGDPGKVTIFGQSSGGTSVWTLMMSPLARGLFHRAIDMSGSYVYSSSLQAAERDNMVFLNRSGCRDLACLRKLSKAQVLKAIPWKEYPYWAAEDLTDLPTKNRFVGPVAVVDGYVLLDVPFSTWENGSGYNKLTPFNASLPKQALDLYPSSDKCPTRDRCAEWQYTTMVSDMRVTCPNNDLARRAAEALKSPVYRYVVTHTPSRAAIPSSLLPFPSRFSFHLLDSLAFFRGLTETLGEMRPADRSFQDIITKYFIHFAKTGEMPNTWPEYPSHTALLSSNFSVVQNHSSERCSLWKSHGFYQYAWIN